MRINIDAAQNKLFVLRDNAGQIVDDTDIVVADDAKGDGILAGALAAPHGSDDAIAETLLQLGSIGAVLTMNLDTSAYGNKTEHAVAIDGLTATGQLVVDAFQVAVDNQDIVLNGLMGQLGFVQHEVGSTLSHIITRDGLVALL